MVYGDEGIRSVGLKWMAMPAPHHPVFTGRMTFLSFNQQRRSTEGKMYKNKLGSFLFPHHVVLGFIMGM